MTVKWMQKGERRATLAQVLMALYYELDVNYDTFMLWKAMFDVLTKDQQLRALKALGWTEVQDAAD